MKRYTALLCVAFLLLIVVAVGSAYLADVGEKDNPKALKSINVYTTLPAENASILATEYEREHHVRVNFIPLASNEILNRLPTETGSDNKASLLVADRETLTRAAAKGYLAPYLSEKADQVPISLREENGYWVGVWYDPVIFCLNRDYLKTLSVIPDSWTMLADSDKVRIGITDFMAADAAANLMYAMIAQFGDAATFDIWRKIHPKVVQYAKYLSNPVRQAGMGEVDIAVAVESEAIRYMQDGYPLKIVYPTDGTAALVTGTGIIYNAKEDELANAKDFADWLLTDEAQQILVANGFYFVPTNPGTIAYKSFAGKNLLLFNQQVLFSAEQKHDFLDYWVKEIRFK